MSFGSKFHGRVGSLDFAFDHSFVAGNLAEKLKEKSKTNQNSPVIQFLKFLGHKAKEEAKLVTPGTPTYISTTILEDNIKFVNLTTYCEEVYEVADWINRFLNQDEICKYICSINSADITENTSNELYSPCEIMIISKKSQPYNFLLFVTVDHLKMYILHYITLCNDFSIEMSGTKISLIQSSAVNDSCNDKIIIKLKSLSDTWELHTILLKLIHNSDPITSPTFNYSQWISDLESRKPIKRVIPTYERTFEDELIDYINLIIRKMNDTEIEKVTSFAIRNELEKKLKRNLKSFRQFINEQVVNCVCQLEPPSKILSFLYLGSQWNANNRVELINNNIGFILNVAKEAKTTTFTDFIKYKSVELYDDPKQDILPSLNECLEYIETARKSGYNILVHCQYGVSRSASIVIAYCMKEYNWDYETSFSFVHKNRSIINPNNGFVEQLNNYYNSLHNSC